MSYAYDGSRRFAALRLEGVERRYGEVRALDGVSLELQAGSFTAVMGPSGSGKSTLLQVASGLDRPTAGRVFVGGDELTGGSETALTKLRRERIGFVFQHFNLLPALSAAQNVELPLRLGRRRVGGQAMDALERVGLRDRVDHRPGELSGGQQQRVAIARALVTDPEVVFADEPTGALDSRSAREVLELVRHVVDAQGRTVVMVTHDPVAAAHADRVLLLADGRLAGVIERPTREHVAERLAHLGDRVAAGEVG